MSELKFRSAGVLGAGLIAALFRTTRFEIVGAEHYQRFRREEKPFIFAFWHGYMLPLVHHHRNEGVVVLVSEHGDGEYITRILMRTGFGTVRGSSTRGGVRGLKGLVGAARRGRDLGITPDGPRGPRGEFKPGALAAAQMTGLPIVGISVGASSGWRSGSWDRFLVPRPFSTITIEYLEPRYVPRGATRGELEEIAAQMGAALNDAERRLNPDLEP